MDDIIKEIKELHDKKNHDYSSGGNYLNFYKNADIWGQDPYLLPLSRLTEKLIRISELRGKQAKNEGIEDSLKDIAILSMISLKILRDKDDKRRTKDSRR